MLLSRLFLWISLYATAIIAQEVVVVTTFVTTVEVTTVKASLTVPSPASYTSLTDFEDTVLQVSNEYRDDHNAEALVWNETLTEYARNWAEGCIWKHSDGPYGENIAFGFANASAAVKAWGDEGELYNFSKPTGYTEETGHFTQLVWKSTIQVGCAAVNCGYSDDSSTSKRDVLAPRSSDSESRAQGWYVVCEYTPVGNVVGDHDAYFKKNVLPNSSFSSTGSNSTSSTSSSGSSAASTTHSSNGCASVQPSMGKIRTMLLSLIIGIGIGICQ